jgi:hypothetical protein
LTVGNNLIPVSNPLTGQISSFSFGLKILNPLDINDRIIITLPADNNITINDPINIQQNSFLTINVTSYPIVAQTDQARSPAQISFTNPTGSLIPGGNVLRILIPSLNCPLNTGSTASLSVETRTSDNFLIDYINNGLGLTAGSLSPSDFKLVTVTASNSRTGGTAQYRFSIIPAITHFVTNVLTIQFPSSYVLPPIL